MQEQNEPITVNAILPGMVATGILSDEIVECVPEQYRTPASLIVEAINNVLADSSITGQAIECSGKDIVFRPPPDYVNEASEYTAGGKYRDSSNPNAVMKLGEKAGKAFDGKECHDTVAPEPNGETAPHTKLPKSSLSQQYREYGLYIPER
jgi:hypothetical protein